VSRIHEALKRAEQERAAAQQNQPEQMSEEPVASHARSNASLEMTSAAAASGPAIAVAPTPVADTLAPAVAPADVSPAAVTYETLLQTCAKPQWAPDSNMLFFNVDENKAGVEQFSSLGAHLFHIRRTAVVTKLLVSSASPREGKSFVAANLAQVIAQQGRRVLLMDLNLKAPGLHLLLGAPSTPGLSEYLLGRSDEFSILQQSPMEDLFFVPAGTRVSRPAEWVASARIKALLQGLENFFEWIVMDAPSAQPGAETRALAQMCDGVIMVVQSDTTSFHMAKRARRQFPGDKLLGLVMNARDGNLVETDGHFTTAERDEEQEKVPSLT
jgi:protein-tyrosine kinase